MANEQQKRRKEELDRFWEIDDLIPAARPPRKYADTRAVELELDPPVQQANGNTEPIPARPQAPTPRFIPPHTPEAARREPDPIEEYTPENALIRRVRIYPWKSDYRYYESFVRDAKRLYAVEGIACQRTTFFSYVPQYAQMNREQLGWYLWWRTCVRHGEMPDTDYSYVLLYVYEILNLEGTLEPVEAREMLCRIWLRYRTIYRQLDSYLPEWICDYSLLHRLPPPNAEELPLSAVMPHCALKEFYVPAGGEEGCILALLSFCSNYDYQKSKFYTKENAALFDTHVKGALQEVVRDTTREGKLFAAARMDDSRMRREAFAGALCSWRIKRRIEVEYCSFSRSHELRFLITDIVKYTENRLRALLGVRSRLSVYALPTAVRTLLDRYLDAALPQRKAVSPKSEAAPAPYERLYELPVAELSLERAAAIERNSWQTTERLIEAFAEDEAPAEALVDRPPEARTVAPITAVSVAPPPAPTADPWAVYRPFLSAVRGEDAAAMQAAAASLGKPVEVLADEINALAADLLDDILLEEGPVGPAVIEDYRDLLDTLLQA